MTSLFKLRRMAIIDLIQSCPCGPYEGVWPPFGVALAILVITYLLALPVKPLWGSFQPRNEKSPNELSPLK